MDRESPYTKYYLSEKNAGILPTRDVQGLVKGYFFR